MEVSLDEWDGGISLGCFAHPGPRTFWLGGGCEGARGIAPVGDVAGEGRCTQPGTDSARKHASTACKHTSPTVCTSKYHHQFEALAPAQNVLGYGVGSAGLDPVPIGKLPTHELVSPSHPCPSARCEFIRDSGSVSEDTVHLASSIFVQEHLADGFVAAVVYAP